MTPTYIIIHHSGVSRSLNYAQFDAIDRYHKSLGWGKIGYHYLIEPNGGIRTGRAENEVGAHTYQNGMNFRSLGVALTGNFDKEYPRYTQLMSLRDLLQRLSLKYSISRYNILFHRNLAKYKSCPGMQLNREFIRNLSVKGDT